MWLHGIVRFIERVRKRIRWIKSSCSTGASSILEDVSGSDGSESRSNSLLDETRYAQPALFALEWSLAYMWRAKGAQPSLVMGHSVGELVAACVAE